MKTYINLEGLLYENMEFEFIRGYESHYGNTHEQQTNRFGVTVKLLNANQEVIYSIAPQVNFYSGCRTGSSSPMGVTHLLVSIPLFNDAKTIEVQSDNKVIFSALVADDQPESGEVVLLADNDPYKISFKVNNKADYEETDYFLQDAQDRLYPITPEQKGDLIYFYLNTYTGLKEGKLCIRQTRQFRSSTIYSENFSIPDSNEIRGHILKPVSNSKHSAHTCFSLIGNLSDENGRAVYWNDNTMVWVLDGKSLTSSCQYTLCENLAPGTHELELRYSGNNRNELILDKINFQVLEKTAEQNEFDQVLDDYLKWKQSQKSIRPVISHRQIHKPEVV